jgi:polyadenylate-binding protein
VSTLLIYARNITDKLNSIDDEQALKLKVDEALSVYDDYMRNRAGEGGANGTAQDEAGEAAEPTAA